jgi:hypothetical protein
MVQIFWSILASNLMLQNISLVHNQRIHGGGTKIRVSPLLTRRESESVKPKLIRQPAILADGDSISSTKSVTFKVNTLIDSKFLSIYMYKRTLFRIPNILVILLLEELDVS